MQKTMKKVLSLILSLLIIMPCVGIIPVNAEGLDRTELDTVIEQANAINADDYVDVSALNAAVEEASSGDLYTQTEVDDATAKIQLELYKLEKVDNAEKKSVSISTYWYSTNNMHAIGTVTAKNVNGGTSVPISSVVVDANQNKRPAKNATAYVYADLNKVSALKDLNVTAELNYNVDKMKYQNSPFHFNNNVLGRIESSATSYSSKTLGPYVLNAALAAKGASVSYQIMDTGTFRGNDNKSRVVTQIIDLTVASYDTSELREAIGRSVGEKSKYTDESYSKYITSLVDAMNIINTPITTVALDGEGSAYADIAVVQTSIENAAEALNNACDNLEYASKFDMTAFNAAVREANIRISESEKYVSVEALQNVLNDVINLTFESQTEVDDATAKVQLELYKLEKVDNAEKKNVFTYSDWFQSGKLKVTGKATVKNVDGGSDVSGTVNVLANTSATAIHPDTNATAYVYADLNKVTSLKDLNVTADLYYTGPWVRYQKTDFYFNEKSLGTLLFDGWSPKATSYTSKSLGSYTLDAELAEKGSSIKYELKDSGTIFDAPDDAAHYVYQIIELTAASYDTTALREAIAKPVDKKSDYSIPTYAAYVEALENASTVLNTPVTTVALDGEGANYADIAAAQTAIDNATKALNDAYDALKKGFDIEYYCDGVLFRTQSVLYTDLESTLISEDIPTKPGYVFNGTWKAEDGTDYTVDKIAHDFVTYDGSVVRLYANFDEIIYTIKFVDGDGNVLQTSSAKYHETVSYNGATPTKTTDDEFEYSFNGSWSPEIGLIEDNTTYVAQFDGTPHNYNYTSSDKNGHSGECTVCGHKIENAHHHFESTEVTENGQKILKSVCKDCGYSVSVSDYTVSVPAGCTVTKTMRTDISEDYVLVTIQAPLKSGVCYFVNWVDGNGNNVGTYRTYSFFLTGDCAFSPNYVLLEDYVNARKKAEIASRVTGISGNKEGTYSIYTEHSVSTAVGSIVGHGVLYTTNAAYNNKNSLVYDNDNISKKAAKSSASTLTGLLEVKDNFTPGEIVYARSYIVTTDGNVIYGDIKTLTVPAIETSSTDGTLSTELFDLTEINADGDETIDPTPETPTPEEPTNPAPQNPLDKLTSIFNKIVEFITMIIKIFKSWEVVK